MATIENASYVGANAYEVDPDSYTNRLTVHNAAGDAALVKNLSTGNHATQVTHDGTNGSLLSVPVVNQVMPITLVNNPAGTVDRWIAGRSDADNTYGWISPIRIPTGETMLSLSMTSTGTDDPNDVSMRVYFKKVHILNTSGVLVDEVSMNYASVRTGIEQWNSVWVGTFRSLTADVTRLIGVLYPKGDGFGNDLEEDVFNITVAFSRSVPTRPQSSARTVEPSGATTPNPYTVPTTTVSGSETMNFTDIDSTLVLEDLPITSHLLTTINQNQNALTEYLTGASAGTNNALTLNPSGGAEADSPTQGVFYDHSKSDNSLGRPVDFPVWSEGFGAIDTDFLGIPDYCDDRLSEPPGLSVSGALSNIQVATASVRVPNFPNGGSSLLYGVFAYAVTSAVDVAITAKVQAENLATSTKAVASASGTAAASGGLVVIEVTAIDFWPDVLNKFNIKMDVDSKNTGSGQVRFLGGSLHFRRS